MSRLWVVATGRWGREVAARLERRAPRGFEAHRIPDDQDAEQIATRPDDLVVLASSFALPQREERLSDEAFTRGHAFLPLAIDGGHLRTGPISFPGGRACSRCYDRRLRQHTITGPIAAAMHDHYARVGDGEGPTGAVPLWAELAAALVVARGVEAAARDAEGAADVLGVDPLTGTVFRSSVAGVHGCTICGTDPGPFQERTVAALTEVLRPLRETRDMRAGGGR